jgi:hypothetical protein
MPTPKKSLADLIWDQTFLARRHAHLLLSSKLVEDDGLRELQQAYRAETSERERPQTRRSKPQGLRSRASTHRRQAGGSSSMPPPLTISDFVVVGDD